MSRDFVGSTAACRRAGITYRQLDYWIRNGAVVPTVPARGPGTRIAWTPLQVEHLAVLGRIRAHMVHLGALTSGGIETSRMRAIWDALEAGRPWSFGIFVDADGTLELVTP